ncbi:MAG: LysM peptidoglycan-binding domain-containing protein, partial [Acidimicrobiia bacterium]
MTGHAPSWMARLLGRAARVVRALVALGALLVLAVGVPLVLLEWGTWPITGVPTWEQVRDLPTAVATDDGIFAVVTVALWGAWLAFVSAVVVEVVAQVRGDGRRATLGIGGPLQGMAHYLVSSVVSVAPLAVSTALATPSTLDAHEPAGFGTTAALTAAPAQPGDPGAPPAAAPSPADAAAATITVARGDTPWSIAQTHLGDGARWREIWEANRGRPQPDGAVWTDADAPIMPGWVLAVPGGHSRAAGDAVPEEAAPLLRLAAQEDPARGEVTVAPGDNFWVIAEAQLAAAWGRPPTDAEIVPYWQELIDRNHDRLVPPGDPDLVFPGQVFVTPATPADRDTTRPADPAPAATDSKTDAPAPEVPAPEVPAPDAPAPDAPAPEVPASDAPASEASDGPATTDPAPPPVEGGAGGGDLGAGEPGGAGGAGGTAAVVEPDDAPIGHTTTSEDVRSRRQAAEADASGSGGPDAPATGESHDAGDERSAPVGLIGGGLAVAGALVLLERRRRAQQRHRRRHRAVPLPTGDARDGERRLRRGADVAGARLLDVMLRAAAAGAGATGLPVMRWVEVSADAVVLVLVEPSPAPPGFVALDATRWMSSAGPEELAAVAGHAAAPAPALVPVGTTEDGADVLMELESSGAVTVHGPEDDVHGLLRAITVAAATALWSDQPRIVPVGLDEQLDRLPGVASAASLGEALALAEAHAERAEAALRSLRCPTLGQARAVGATPEAWDPLIVVAAVPPRDGEEQRRVGALAGRRNGAVGLVTRPGIEGGQTGRALAIDERGWLRIEGVDHVVRPRHLSSDEVRGLVDLLEGATRRIDVHRDEAVVELAPRRPAPADRAPPQPEGSPGSSDGGLGQPGESLE